MPCNCSQKKTTCSKVSVNCAKITSYSVNSFTYNKANDNLSLIGKTLCSFKESIDNFVNQVQLLNNELLYGTGATSKTVSNSLKKYNVLQRNFLNEVKALADAKLYGTVTTAVGLSVSNNINPSDLSNNLNNAENYFKDSNGSNIVKICPSKTYNVNFNDGTSLPVLNVPSFSFNFDSDNDNISVRVSYKDDYLSANSEKIKYYTIAPDTQDGYLYKDDNGIYEGDLEDAHVPSELVNKSLNNLMEYYESIVNYKEGQTGLLAASQANSVVANDIDSFVKFLDLSIYKVNAALSTVSLKCKVLQ